MNFHNKISCKICIEIKFRYSLFLHIHFTQFCLNCLYIFVLHVISINLRKTIILIDTFLLVKFCLVVQRVQITFTNICIVFVITALPSSNCSRATRNTTSSTLLCVWLITQSRQFLPSTSRQRSYPVCSLLLSVAITVTQLSLW